jgi:cyanophycinase-like exopeptidase
VGEDGTVIVLMGSGETSPTMVELHKSLVRDAGRVTVLDTPYGFQENADELTAKAVAYFTDSVGVPADVVSLRTTEAPAAELGRALHALSAARYVFSGPGSPTYALRQWRALGLGEVLADVVRSGGVVVLASAAAVTAGVRSIPVYEVYKVGQAPYWEDGLDVLGRLGLRAAVVPHFDNAEGGTHDTSCCWIGRRRLDALRAKEPDLPVLGIDEHTAVVIDPVAGTATVHGQGSAHVLVGDAETHHARGTSFDLRAALGASGTLTTAEPQVPALPGLAEAVADKDAAAVLAALAGTADLGTATALAALEPVLRRGWAEPDVALLLAARSRAREDKQWALSDLLRDGLAALGVVVEDTPEGQRVGQG